MSFHKGKANKNETLKEGKNETLHRGKETFQNHCFIVVVLVVTRVFMILKITFNFPFKRYHQEIARQCSQRIRCGGSVEANQIWQLDLTSVFQSPPKQAHNGTFLRTKTRELNWKAKCAKCARSAPFLQKCAKCANEQRFRERRYLFPIHLVFTYEERLLHRIEKLSQRK